ncbi:hypothetical protein B0T16DRAFT_407065 [Cercophora newfieldiana]|uniref:Uncharacterized protein n=1 Tax=Cercophora newfieldiana TaxID=92897 RepID=A0AA39YHW2_9PEZI|nr:hypothetical protein B0T16DRAFT_407065 [Cercophora newfieldiana]
MIGSKSRIGGQALWKARDRLTAPCSAARRHCWLRESSVRGERRALTDDDKNEVFKQHQRHERRHVFRVSVAPSPSHCGEDESIPLPVSLSTARSAQGSRRSQARLVQIRQLLEVVSSRPMSRSLSGLADGPGSFHQRRARPLAENPWIPPADLLARARLLSQSGPYGPIDSTLGRSGAKLRARQTKHPSALIGWRALGGPLSRAASSLSLLVRQRPQVSMPR